MLLRSEQEKSNVKYTTLTVTVSPQCWAPRRSHPQVTLFQEKGLGYVDLSASVMNWELQGQGVCGTGTDNEGQVLAFWNTELSRKLAERSDFTLPA